MSKYSATNADHDLTFLDIALDLLRDEVREQVMSNPQIKRLFEGRKPAVPPVLTFLKRDPHTENGFIRHDILTSSFQIASLKNGNKTISIGYCPTTINMAVMLEENFKLIEKLVQSGPQMPIPNEPVSEKRWTKHKSTPDPLWPKVVVFQGTGMGKTLLKKSLIKYYKENGISWVSVAGNTYDVETAMKDLSGFKGFVLIEVHGLQALPVVPWQTITFSGGFPD